MAQQTRHGLYGGPRPAYSSFAEKVNALTISVTAIGLDRYSWTVPRDQLTWSVPTDRLAWAVPRDRVEV